MKLQQTQNNVASMWMLRVFYYITRPFQISKILELLYALNWTWYWFLSLLPRNIVAGPVMQTTNQINQIIVSLVFLGIASISAYALIVNHVILRRVVLLFNIVVILSIFARLAFQTPIVGTAGYLFILAGLSIFSYWRMDTHDY